MACRWVKGIAKSAGLCRGERRGARLKGGLPAGVGFPSCYRRRPPGANSRRRGGALRRRGGRSRRAISADVCLRWPYAASWRVSAPPSSTTRRSTSPFSRCIDSSGRVFTCPIGVLRRVVTFWWAAPLRALVGIEGFPADLCDAVAPGTLVYRCRAAYPRTVSPWSIALTCVCRCTAACRRRGLRTWLGPRRGGKRLPPGALGRW